MAILEPRLHKGPGYQPQEGDRDPSRADYPEREKVTPDEAEVNDPGDDDVGEDDPGDDE